jgi:hypothetical protein
MRFYPGLRPYLATPKAKSPATKEKTTKQQKTRICGVILKFGRRSTKQYDPNMRMRQNKMLFCCF